MSIDQDNIVELTDEDGKVVQFEHIDTVEHEGNSYVLLLPLEPLEGVDEDEEGVVILKIIQSEDDDEDTYEGVEDEDLLDAVFEKYLATVEDEEEDE